MDCRSRTGPSVVPLFLPTLPLRTQSSEPAGPRRAGGRRQLIAPFSVVRQLLLLLRQTARRSPFLLAGSFHLLPQHSGGISIFLRYDASLIGRAGLLLPLAIQFLALLEIAIIRRFDLRLAMFGICNRLLRLAIVESAFLM